jgi:hypothetical protein
MKYRFHSTAAQEPSKYENGLYVAHEKHTLTNPDNPDVVICVIVRRILPKNTTVEQINDTKRENGAIFDPVLRELAEKYDWLE